MRQTAVLSMLMLFLLCTSAKAEDIIGKWKGKTPEGDVISYEFKKDNSVTWNLDKKDFPGPVTAHYSVDYSTKPALLDMSEFSIRPLKGILFVGIVEFLSPTKMKIDGVQVRASGVDKRPKQFTRRAIEFDKIE